MWLPIAGLLTGIFLGMLMPFTIPLTLSKYFSVAILAGLDTTIGGIRAGLENQFNLTVFVSGFTCNIFIAILLVYLGDLLGIDLYFAAIIVFGVRLFNNVTTIRRIILKKVWNIG